jgi:uncharacterized protein (TIGR02231 family)
MRAFRLLTVLAVLTGSQAFAGEGSVLPASSKLASDIQANSKIEAVTVFPSGAEITRTLKVKLGAGEQAVLVNDVTGQAIAASIRVEGTAGGKLEIGSVDARRVELPSTDPAVTQSARRQLEDQIEKLSDERGVQGDIASVAKEQLTYLHSLEKRPQTVPSAGAGGTAATEDWDALFGVLGKRLTELSITAREARLKQRGLDRQIKELKKELAALGSKTQDRTEIRIYVKAAEPLEAILALRYQVSPASWTAFYDARLTTGDQDKSSAAKLSIARYASIGQTTGEDWDDVALALSTTRPGTATAAPELHMLSVDFGSDAAAPPPPASGQVVQYDKRAYTQSDGLFDERTKTVQVKKVLTAGHSTVQTIASSFQAVYKIPGHATIKSTGEAKRLQVAAEELDPALLVRTVPRLDTTAYLYAKLTLPKTSSPMLAGQVSLLRDGVFAGNGEFPQLSPGEDFELGFGADERVRVKRIVSEDKKGETGTFTTSRTEERSYVVSVKNLHTRGVELQILDRMPVPMHQDIKSDFTMTKGPQPAQRDINGRRGTLLWQMKAAQDEEIQLAFGYRLTAPAGKPLQYRELTDEDLQLNRLQEPPRPAGAAR